MTKTPVEFIGRRKEIETLRERYASKDSAFLPIYGRRRVGKSELILHFTKSHPTLYFVGKQAPAAQQMREFLETAARTLNEPLLAAQPADRWKTILEQVTERWKSRQKLILVFDEFQWTAEKSPELTSVLQEMWDRQWQKSGRIMLILCGSYIGFMEREVLGKKSPLFGRRTGQIFLKPFGYREAASFHPSLSLSQKAMTYFVCGGVPLYLRYFHAARSVIQNIEQLLLNEHAPLYAEPDFLLREELREVENYYAILRALASGSLPSRQIAELTGIGDRSLHYYLDNLVGLGYLGRQYPVTGKPAAVRHVRYALLDPLLRFWFRFVYPHEGLIAQLGPQKAMAQLIRPSLESYFGGCFETLCRQALPLLYERERVSAAFEVGTYWDKNVQIDVVGLRDDGWTDLGECKWGSLHSFGAVVDSLKAKAALYPNNQKNTVGLRLFVQDPPRARASHKEVRTHSLADLYAR